MTKLTDTQRVILSAAAGRDDRTVLPLPKSLKIGKEAATTVLKALTKKGLMEETPAAPSAEYWREDKTGHKFAVAINGAGLTALDVKSAATPSKQPENPRGSTSIKNVPSGKAGLILSLVSRPKGARINELLKATGWQAHSIRAALTGLRKRGITVSRSQNGGVTVYRAEGV